MPTYDYVCNACGHAFEEFQSITAPTLKKCPECRKPKLKRLIGTGAGVIFKGSGFYETDYRSDSYKSAAKADKEGSTSTSTTSASSGDSGNKSDSNSGNGGAKADAKPAPAAKSDAPAGKKPTKSKAS